MILMIDHGRMPTPSKHLDRILLRDLPVDVNGTYSYFVGSKENNNKTGRYFVAVGILNPTRSLNPNTILTRDSFEDTFDDDYTFRVYVSGCYYFDADSLSWSGRALQVVEATPTIITCATAHLTPFGFGFVPTPNMVDFDYIFANVGFIDNLTLYLVLIILTCLYIIMMIWGHYRDRKDIELRGVIPLPNNNPDDKYLYEITFHTGPDSEASTDSNIMFILSGNFDETEVCPLPPANNRLYRRFGTDSFVLATSKPLGPLKFLRVFHDNMGEPPLDSWQLEMVVVRDLQLSQKFIFDTKNSWLSLSRGKIDQIFAVSNDKDEKSFSQNIYIRSNRTSNQDHMWMSMFLRPVGSRFGRKERVSVCAVFLYLSMLTSALWYDSSADSSRDGYFDFGPFTLSSEQLLIGVSLMIFVYPFVYLLTLIFKRARPKNLKKCRAIHAIEKQREEQLISTGIDPTEAESNSKVEVKDHTKPKAKDKNYAKCLPWWTRIIAWIFVLISIGVSIFFVWSYGIMWGEIKTVKWFSSFIVAFFISILVTQWLKVMLYSLVLSSVCKSDLSADDIDCDEELPALKQNEEWLYPQPLDDSIRKRVHRVEGVDIEDPEVDKIRTRMVKEREMGFVLRGILVYCIFLAIVAVLINERTDYNAFLLQENLSSSFIKENNLIFDFTKLIRNTNEWWNWARNVVLQELRAQRHYNGKPPYGLRGFLDDQANRIMGYAIIRQIRSKRNNCQAPGPFESMIENCSGSRGIVNEDSKDFCAGWIHNESFSGACKWDEYKYKTADELGTYSYVGKLGMYSGGGYVLRLSGRQDWILKRMEDLQKNKWIDGNTRAVILEFSVYNANVNLFATCTILAEFNEGGGIIPKWRFEPLRLIKDDGIQGFITTVCEILFACATVFFTLKEFWNMKKQKCSYFNSYWNIAEICIILVSYGTIVIYVYRGILTEEALNTFNLTKGNGYVRIDSAANLDQYYLYTSAVISFFSILKLIKLLQFNKKMDVLALTIRNCWDELKMFLVAFGIVFFAFSCLFFFMFTAAIEEFSQIIPAIQTSFKMMMGKFDFEAMNQANSLSPLLFFIFSVMNSMILINIMLTIILQAFNEVKIELQNKENRLNVIDYVWSSFKQFLRKEQLNKINVEVKLNDKKERRREDSSPENNSHVLPDKVGQLLHYVNNVYFEGKLDLNDPIAKKSLMEGKIPTNYGPNFNGGKRVYSSDQT
ncbi:UNVERIFIED_CONTAM: hypothetical protein GTU68_050411 [Idotea baltica]|nr:hypothetical protein [Idotea baltica]